MRASTRLVSSDQVLQPTSATRADHTGGRRRSTSLQIAPIPPGMMMILSVSEHKTNHPVSARSRHTILAFPYFQNHQIFTVDVVCLSIYPSIHLSIYLITCLADCLTKLPIYLLILKTVEKYMVHGLYMG